MSRYVKPVLAVLIFALITYTLHATIRPHNLLPYLRQHQKNPPIPPIVHYVVLKTSSDTSSTSDAPPTFTFAHFLSLYAAQLYTTTTSRHPPKIVIHTDHNATSIAYAASHGTIWTRKVLTAFPSIVEWRFVPTPAYSGTGEKLRITAVQHRADFVRWDAIAEEGGIYLDFDVVLLRSLEPLMRAGFAFVVGRQMYQPPCSSDSKHEEPKNVGDGKEQDFFEFSDPAKANNGVFLAVPNSLMARTMQREQSAHFSPGDWESNLRFTTAVAERLSTIPGEALLLDRNAFAPAHWGRGSTDGLFLHHETAAVEPASFHAPESSSWTLPSMQDSPDAQTLYDELLARRRSRRSWEWDLSSSYALHAFKMSEYTEWITPRKVLARTSNYGVAVWETVVKMVEEGLIDGTEDVW